MLIMHVRYYFLQTHCFSLSVCLSDSVTKSCERNSYSFSRIFLKLQVFLSRSEDVYMTFGCNIQINFCYFFRSLWGLKHLNTGYLVSATPTVLTGSF